ncbi:helix-turn-helix transcriptional regulator [Aliisedimentitalea scapharcae]|uniref:Helix-turn-helix transcriptional regulator n=1 Tax=Aliisedimentitalea scapharcae TaxID=1524259 RepID=A0ABZ2XRB0_9RHOB|nr:helix-turn-helix transcriptional regulator [Rhodobacteraceae bacterium M382]
MDDNFPPRPLPRDDVAALVAAVPTPDFANRLLDYVRRAADIANIGTFHVADMSRPEPVLSFWGGDMSGYWFNRNANVILSDDRLIDSILDRIRASRDYGLTIERWRPDPSDPLSPIYARDGVIERVTTSSWTDRVGLQTFLLRGEKAGWITDTEMERLQRVLPLVHELIGLRHRITGSMGLRTPPTARVSALRDRDSGLFGHLTPREAEICDFALQGVTVAGTALELGISENTVRTLRRRAWAKLGVNSATQVAALILSEAT